MRKMLGIIVILIVFNGCRSTEKVITKQRVLQDSLIIHEMKLVKLPVKNLTVIESPCRGDSLIEINQVLKTTGSTLKIKKEKGDLLISLDLDSVISVERDKILKQLDHSSEIREITVIKKKIPSVFWWVLIYSVFITVWIFRKSLLRAIKPI